MAPNQLSPFQSELEARLAAITATARLPDHSPARLFRFWHQADQSPARREVSY